jgi:hypothetical protein
VFVVSLVFSALPSTLPTSSRAWAADDGASLDKAVANVAGATPNAVAIVVVEESEDWVYGTVSLSGGPGGAPDIRFFLANRVDGDWTVALRYTETFAALLARAPADFPSPDVRASLDGVSAAADGSLDLSFPFPVGQTWAFDGPTPLDEDLGGTSASRPALAFFLPSNPLDMQSSTSIPNAPVTAMRGGIAYRPCSNLVLIDHLDGSSAAYQRLTNITVANGQMVARGQRIGSTSDAGPSEPDGCGGTSSPGFHAVYIWIRSQSQVRPINDVDIGGWTVQAHLSFPNSGCLFRGSDYRCLIRDGESERNNVVTNEGEHGSSVAPNAAVSVENLSSAFPFSTHRYDLVGFPANASLTLEWLRPDRSTVLLGSTRTNFAGAAAGRFTIPETPWGGQNVLAVRAGGVTRFVPVVVNTESRMTPQVVARGDVVTFTLRGFPASQPIPITFRPTGQSAAQIGAPVASALGSATFTYTVPVTTPLGQIEVFVDNSLTAGIDSALFLELTSSAQVVLNPDQGPPGAQTIVSLRGYPANTDVTVSIDGVTVGTVRTDSQKKADLPVTIPAAATGLVHVTGTAGTTSRSATYQVKPSLSLAPAVASPGEQIVATFRGIETDFTLVNLQWNDGETWNDIGNFGIPNGTATFTVPGEAVVGTTILIRSDNLYATLTIVDPTPGPPVADAGPDQALPDTQGDGESVTLDGANSSAPDGTIASFVWKRNGTQIATGVAPTVDLNSGVHTIVLTVTDNTGAIDTDEVTISIGRPPVAKAKGPDKPLSSGASVQLDGSDSDDPDGTIVSYTWHLANGSLIATGENPTINSMGRGRHQITLTVTDNHGLVGADEVVVIVGTPPVAEAGPPQSDPTPASGGQSVQLNGSASTSPGGTIVSYVWRENGVELANSAAASVSVTLQPGFHTIELTVTNDLGLTDTDIVTVSLGVAPVVRAGEDQKVSDLNNNGAESVKLYGGVDELHINGRITSYVWKENGKVLKSFSFIPDGGVTVVLPVGVHTLVLTIGNDQGFFGSDSVKVTVLSAPPKAIIAGAAHQTKNDPQGDGENIILDGSQSSDPNGPIASYDWRIGSKQIATTAKPKVKLLPGQHDIVLTVADSQGQKRTDSVRITVLYTPSGTGPAVSLRNSQGATIAKAKPGLDVVYFAIARFPRSSIVNIRLKRANGTILKIRGVQTDSTGRASGTFKIPATPGGKDQHIQFGVGGSTSKELAFEVVSAIRVSPTTVSRNGKVNISLRGFKAGEDVNVYWYKGTTSTWVPVKKVKASPSGSADILNYPVPNWAPDGRARIRAEGNKSSAAETSSLTVEGGTFQASEARGRDSRGTRTPTPTPTPTATPETTETPSATPSAEATPTTEPTSEATTPDPTVEPTQEPTAEPTVEPTVEPTPTPEPTEEPTLEPTPEPTLEPTPEPTPEPTAEPTVEPTPTPEPTEEPEPITESEEEVSHDEGGEETDD